MQTEYNLKYIMLIVCIYFYAGIWFLLEKESDEDFG